MRKLIEAAQAMWPPVPVTKDDKKYQWKKDR